MASLVSIFLLLAFTSFFSSSSAEVSRKELRSEEANKETFIHFGHSVHSNRIDPSRAVQLSWRPRSGSFYIKVSYQMRSVTTLFLWRMVEKRIH